MIDFGRYSYILSFGFLNGLVVALLLARTRENRVANRVLAALLLVVVLRLVPYIIGYAGFYDVYPWLSFAPFDLPLAIGPLLWLYVERLTTGQLPSRWRWHLLPAAVHAAATTGVFVFCTLSQKNWIAKHIVDPFVAPTVTGASLVALAFYAWKALARVRAYQQWLDGHLSNREEFRLSWLRILLLIFAGTGVVWLVVALVDAFVTPLSYVDEFPFYVFQTMVAWSLGLLATRHAATVYPIPSTSEAVAELVAEAVAPRWAAEPPNTVTELVTEPGTESSSAAVTQSVREPLTEPASEPRAGMDWASLGQRYLTQIRASRWERDPQLTLATLARHLGTNTSYLSRALNQGVGQSFNEGINRLRVESVAAELRDGSTRDLVQIGFDAGFNSKASFQRAFQTYMRCTPGAYREACRAGRKP